MGNLVGGQKIDGTQAVVPVTVSVPNKWLIAANAQRGLVVAVLNAGPIRVALNSSAAVEFSTAMTKQAAVVSSGKTPGP